MYDIAVFISENSKSGFKINHLKFKLKSLKSRKQKLQQVLFEDCDASNLFIHNTRKNDSVISLIFYHRHNAFKV